MVNQAEQDTSVSSPDLTTKSKEEIPRAVRHYHQILLYIFFGLCAFYSYVVLVNFVQTQKEIAKSHISIQTENKILFEKIIMANDNQGIIIAPITNLK